MKKKTVILIDGENVSHKRAGEIAAISKRLGNVTERKVYHRRTDPVTRPWTEQAKSNDCKDIRLDGGPAKNKVDRRMQKDARRYFKMSCVGTVCIVTSDGGFRCLAEDAANAGKKLCFIGGKKASRKLRRSGCQFIELG